MFRNSSMGIRKAIQMVPFIKNSIQVGGARITIAWGLSLFLLCTFGQGAIAAEDQITNRILVIYGNPLMESWEQNFNRILLERLSTEEGIPLTPEHLSFLSVGGAVESGLMAESLRLKYSRSKIDLVIAVFPEANSFLFEWGHIFSPNSSRLYILPSNDVLNKIPRNEANTVLESSGEVSTANTLQLVPQLLPGVQHIIVVGGSGDGDISYLERVERAVNDIQLNVEVSYLSGLTSSELLTALESETDNSAILLGPYDLDNSGQIYRGVDIVSMLRDETSIPVFGILSGLIGSGAVGGYVSSSKLTAEQTVELGLSILSSEPILEDLGPRSAFTFDGDQLDRFSIDRSLLPAGSIIINDEVPYWRQYLPALSLGVIVIFAQLLFIIALIRSKKKRLLAEKGLLEAQKMEALGNLSGGIAHDFNNILMAITGNAELASYSLDGDPAIIKNNLSKILVASEKAKNLIQQILLFSRSSHEDDVGSLNLRILLEEPVSLIKGSAADNIKIDLTCSSDLWSINANSTQIEQVIMNLCVNAEQAMKNGGEIRVTANNKTTSKPMKLVGRILPPGDYVRVSISDTGVGISPENMSRIFEPFFTTKSQDQGTGLGLALVYGIVKRHGGFLDLKSQPGRGTTVTIYFKAVKEGVAKPERPTFETVSNRTSNKEMILLVDDDEMVIDSMSKILEHLGYQAESHTSSVEALRHFKSNPDKYDLIISDLSMPEMDGMRLISNIRRQRPDLPAILCTGFADALDSLETENISNFTILHKPVSIAGVLEAVSNAL